jgi:hypothetical protein
MGPPESLANPEPASVLAHPGAPPWLWFWIVLFLTSVPDLWSALLEGSRQFIALERDGLARLRALDAGYGRFDILRVAGVVVDWLGPAIVVAGVAVAMCPWLRRYYVERRYGVRDPSSAPPGFAAIRDFIERNAPGTIVTVNLLRRETAFVYPLGYRRAAIAVCGGLYKLWQTDRPAAEAVLLHEMAHCRRGDFLVLGTGSPISSGLKYVFLFYLIFLALPQLMVSIADAISLRARLLALEQPVVSVGGSVDMAGAVSRHYREQAWGHISGQLVMLASASLQFVRFLVLPLAGIWAAELNADHFVVVQQGSSAAIQRGLGSLSRSGWWWRWPLNAVTHPPRWLRRLSMRFRTLGLLNLVAILLIAYFVRLAVMHAWASISYLFVLGFTTEQIASATLDNTRQYLAALFPVWLAMAALVAVWPWVFKPWEALFVNETSPRRVSRDSWIYAVVAAACLLLATFALWL